jgi:acetylornithine deacetylase/succinyl-diaminopimelate desuccinylase-like protein
MSFIAGDPEGASRSAIPSVASADLAVHTVPDQTVAEVAEQLREWVADRIGDGFAYTVDVAEEGGQEPYATPPELPALAALAEAMEAGFGRSIHHIRNAGGAPAELLARVLSAPVVFFGTGLPEDQWHDSDESVHVATLVSGAVSLAEFWPRLARLDAAQEQRRTA